MVTSGDTYWIIDTDSNIPVELEGFPFSQMSMVIRILEQFMISIIGLHQTVSKINFKEDKENDLLFSSRKLIL